MKKIDNALILAGGDSTRFWPLQKKPLFSFLNKPMLLQVIEMVKDLTDKIVVVTNKEDESLVKKIDEKLQTVIQTDLSTGMAGAVLSSKEVLQGSVLILNVTDIFNPVVIRDLLKHAEKTGADLTFVAKKVKTYFPGAYLELDKEGKLTGLVEKPAPEKVPSSLVNLVVDYFKDSAEIIKFLESASSEKDDIYEVALTRFIKEKKVEFVTYEDYWLPLKYPWHVLNLMLHFLRTSGDQVILGKNVKIAKTARVIGPCFIDDNTVIGDFTLVRECHIGKNCLIGGYSEVTRSYLGDGVSLHRNYVGDSVLDKNVLFGAQAATANFRFDTKTVKSVVNENKIDTGLTKLGAIVGANSKIGVNSTLLPGIKIGKKTFIAPGYTIAEDVKDEMFIFKRKTVENKHFNELKK